MRHIVHNVFPRCHRENRPFRTVRIGTVVFPFVSWPVCASVLSVLSSYPFCVCTQLMCVRTSWYKKKNNNNKANRGEKMCVYIGMYIIYGLTRRIFSMSYTYYILGPKRFNERSVGRPRRFEPRMWSITTTAMTETWRDGAERAGWRQNRLSRSGVYGEGGKAAVRTKEEAPKSLIASREWYDYYYYNTMPRYYTR